ncbi:adenylate cyclase [Ectopseudomonas mendocina]|uniref:Adenylate cyclase n=1 Tax=Ectopseudomonas mendocina TaxID=300 RepID=A0ABZ2RGR8_ECTME
MNILTKAGSKTKQLASVAALISISTLAGASELLPAFGLANDEYAFTDKAGAYEVSTTAVGADCRGLVGTIAKLVLTDPDLKCSSSFPYGFSSPVSVSVYYPENIKDLDKLPVVDFVGGILSNDEQYTRMVEQWVSYGFIVVSSTNFINSLPTMHILGALEVSKLNKDPSSPLYGKVDLGRTVIAGHSAGGGATIQVSALPDSALRLIDPELKVLASLPIEPGPLGSTSLSNVPTLVLTGAADVVVLPIGWTQLWQSDWAAVKAPAWLATANNATHFSPVRENAKNEFAGITTAWLLYTAKNDLNAKGYFVGRDYKLAKDPQFKPLLNPLLKVRRNKLADQLK